MTNQLLISYNSYQLDKDSGLTKKNRSIEINNKHTNIAVK